MVSFTYRSVNQKKKKGKYECSKVAQIKFWKKNQKTLLFTFFKQANIAAVSH